MLNKASAILLAATAALLGGCNSGKVYNNHLALKDFAAHLTERGLPVEQVQPVNPGPLKAADAIAIKFKDNENEIGVYRYDSERAGDAKRLKKYSEDGYVYVVGFKYPALVKGSFVVIGYEKNILKPQLIEAVESFE